MSRGGVAGARQQREQIRMNAVGSTLTPYGSEPKRPKPSSSEQDDEDA